MKEIDAKTKQKIIALISALVPEAKIYLFGSRARKTNTAWSDIEIVDFHSIPQPMQENIIREKEIWKD